MAGSKAHTAMRRDGGTLSQTLGFWDRLINRVRDGEIAGDATSGEGYKDMTEWEQWRAIEDRLKDHEEARVRYLFELANQALARRYEAERDHAEKVMAWADYRRELIEEYLGVEIDE